MGGHISGGGFGYYARNHGLAADRVVGIRVILYNGTIIEATNETNADLFWALRGGGSGSFGFIVSFLISAFKSPINSLIQMKFPSKYSASVLNIWMNKFIDIDERLTTKLDVSSHGTKITGQFQGTGSELNTILFQTGIMDIVNQPESSSTGIKNCTSLEARGFVYGSHSGTCNPDISVKSHPSGKSFFKAKSGYGPNPLNETGIDLILNGLSAAPDAGIQFKALGGIFKTQANDYTPFSHRDMAFSLHLMAGTKESSIIWIKEFYQSLSPYLSGGAYQNYADLDLGDQFGVAYWGENFETLKTIKQKYDPMNLFSNPQSVPLPSSTVKVY